MISNVAFPCLYKFVTKTFKFATKTSTKEQKGNKKIQSGNTEVDLVKNNSSDTMLKKAAVSRSGSRRLLVGLAGR